MPMATVCVTSLKWRAARMELPVTTMLTQRTTTAAVPNSTSAVCAAVTASQKARATAKAMSWTSAAYAAVTASPTARATVTVTCWMSAAFVAVTALPTARATVMGMALKLATTATATAS